MNALAACVIKDCRADARSVLAESVYKPTIMARTEVLNWKLIETG